MTRQTFLQESGMFVAGLAFASGSLLAKSTGPKDGRSLPLSELGRYQIVVPDQATPPEREAAAKLQQHLSELVGLPMQVTTESDYRGKPAFLIGHTHFSSKKRIDVASIDRDGFVVQPSGKSLLIVGGAGNGTLYGVYGLLERFGFRMYEAGVIEKPQADVVNFPERPMQVNPIVQYRTTSYRDTRDLEYTEWQRLSSRDAWGLFVHTFNELVPPDQYGKAHPEYFSFISGTRLPGTQLCLSNPEVLRVLTISLKEKVAAKPSATYWSVSQNDNDQYCRCDACTKLNATYGGVPSGSILFFVNQVAKAFPDKTISTLAYWYSRGAPSGIKPEANVNIMLCNIESRRQAPVFQTDPAFSRDLAAWGRMSDNILIWDYNIQFTNLVSPFPNLHTIKPNVKFYTENHVRSLYMQANGQTRGEFSALRAYLICRLMWDPEADDVAIVSEFLRGYYGRAASFIQQYIDLMRQSLVKSGLKLNIFGGPEDAKDGYLSASMISAYEALFDQAENAVASSPDHLRRVKMARLPVTYAAIQIGRDEVDTPRSLFVHDANGTVDVRPAMKASILQFVRLCQDDGVTRLRERSITPADYQTSYDRVFSKVKEAQGSKSFAKQVQAASMPDGDETAVRRLTDGMFGSFESWSAPDVNWVAYKGQHMDFTLDLGQVTAIRAVVMDFLNAQAQPDWNLLVLPRYVTYAFSEDGSAFGEPIKVDNPHNPNPKENPDIAKVQLQSFQAAPGSGVRARYVKVHAESMLKMPSWHIRAGHPASILTDQILVV